MRRNGRSLLGKTDQLVVLACRKFKFRWDPKFRWEPQESCFKTKTGPFIVLTSTSTKYFFLSIFKKFHVRNGAQVEGIYKNKSTRTKEVQRC